MEKIYMVGVCYYKSMISDGSPNASNFPSKVYTDIKEAQAFFEALQKEWAGDYAGNPYMVEWDLTTNTFTVVNGNIA